MKTFLENSIVKDSNSFINLMVYIKELFANNSFKLQCPIDKLQEIELLNFNSFIVHLEDKTVEGNLRMVDSYLPELLFALSRMNKNYENINELTQRSEFDCYYLKYKFQHFFEVLLFSDFFYSVFDGKLSNERCYVYKDKELYFFSTRNTQNLFNILFNKLTLSAVLHQSNNMIISEIRFLLIP